MDMHKEKRVMDGWMDGLHFILQDLWRYLGAFVHVSIDCCLRNKTVSNPIGHVMAVLIN